MRQSVEAVCRACLGVAVAVYIVVFCRLTFGLYDRYQMMAFDLGIFDQTAWLISQGQTPFVTVRGIHLLGDHFSAFLYLLAPLYRLWDSPKTLLLAQTAALALGALPVYGLARRKTGSAPAAPCPLRRDAARRRGLPAPAPGGGLGRAECRAAPGIPAATAGPAPLPAAPRAGDFGPHRPPAAGELPQQ